VRSREKFEALGMIIAQNGDQEGAAIFDPSDPRQAKAAITAIQAKKMRELSPERDAVIFADLPFAGCCGERQARMEDRKSCLHYRLKVKASLW
jgi:hypothetical protein